MFSVRDVVVNALYVLARRRSAHLNMEQFMVIVFAHVSAHELMVSWRTTARECTDVVCCVVVVR